jgi:glycosyltransferase involved in cell wall biosynthesis
MLNYIARCWKSRGISIIIPFRRPVSTGRRSNNLQWLLRYWRHWLPLAEVIIGQDPQVHLPFSKSVAVNDGVRRATGDILVIVDADGYVPYASVLKCASEIRKARRRDKRLWFVPYRKFFRLSKSASDLLLASDPKNPLFSEPPHAQYVQGDADPNVGHWYGAMVQILPTEAFIEWDPRFRGWGGEDHAAMRATDTLYWPHKTLPNHVLHMWHPQIGPQGTDSWIHWKERMWEGQVDPSVNDRLSWRYYHATGNPRLMRKLVEEGLRFQDHCHHHHHEHKHRHKHRHRRLSC